MTTTGIAIFEGAEELDVVGPWEVLGVSAALRSEAESGRSVDRAVLVAESLEPVRCAQGMRMLPDATFDASPPIDVLLVPGGVGTRTEVDNPAILDWLRRTAPVCRWVTSVCTGVLLLHEAGPARGHSVATHWSFEDDLERRGDVTVVRDQRWVVDGNLVTSQGVSAGIDMTLWLVGEMYGVEHARAVRRQMQYEPEPPYSS